MSRAEVLSGLLEIRFAPQQPIYPCFSPMKSLLRPPLCTRRQVSTKYCRELASTRANRYAAVHSAPSPRLYEEGAILVNKEGKRFTDEMKERAIDAARQPDKVAFMVFDAKVARKFRSFPYFISTFPGVAYAYIDDYRRSRKDIFSSSDRLVILATQTKIDPKGLVDTINRYNRFVMLQEDSDFGRATLSCKIDTPPFYALGPIKAWVLLTEGGVA